MAEASLQKGEFPAAEGHYREALFEGWLLMGTLERLEERLAEARDAYGEAPSRSRPGAGRGCNPWPADTFEAGGAAPAVDILTALAAQDARDVETRRLLARALLAAGQPERAAQRLDEAVATGPDDPEVVFLLASEYLWLKRLGRRRPPVRARS